MDEIAEPRDEGGRSMAVSALLHACVIGLFFLAPPGTPAISLEETFSQPLQTHLLAVVLPSRSVSSSPSPSLSPSPSSSLSLSPSPSLSLSPSRSLSLSRSLSSSPSLSLSHADALAPLTALALALDSVAHPAFLAEDALARVDGRAVDVGDEGLDMIGTGRGTGGGGGDTIGAPRATAFGMGSISATCSDEELVARTALVGRAMAVASCSGSSSSGLGVAGFATRAARPGPDAVDASPQRGRVHFCSATCAGESSGSLTRDVVRRVVARHRSEIRSCYEHALGTRPDLEGRVTIAWVIAPDGRVRNAALDASRSDVRDGEVETCITNAVARWTFPSSEGLTVVSYPFVLGRSDAS